MIDLSNKSAVILDHGIFLELAFRLCRDFGTIYYVDPSWEEAFPKIDHAVIGDGFDRIERVGEIWDVIDKVDVCVFPDVGHGSMQMYLQSQGMPVWGSRKSDRLEVNKVAFRKLQKELGMEVPEYHVVRGLDALREMCQNPDYDDRWIKLSPQFRGNRETFHHENYESSREILDGMGVDFGIVQDILKFVAEKSIEADLEGGLDTYTVDGEHPSVAVQGYESKDKCYFAVVQPYEKIPKEITSVNEYLWPILKQYQARQFISTEVKITEDKKSFLLEPTIRMPSPAGEEQLELYANMSQIVFEGAHGKLVEPELTATFACEAMVEHTGDEKRWRSLVVPDSIRQWVKLYNTVKVGDSLGICPGSRIIGAVVGIGDSPTEALEHLKENAEGLTDQPVITHVSDLAKIIQEIEEAEDKGIEFTDKPMPEPAEAIPE